MTNVVTSALRAWQAEGAAAVRDRLLDRVVDARHHAFSPFTTRLTGHRVPHVPLLNVIGVPLAVRFGGVPLQLATRLRHEATHRPVALLSRDTGRRWRLDVWTDGGRRRASTRFPAGEWNGDVLSDDEGWREAARRSCELLHAPVVHVENAAELSLVSLARLVKDANAAAASSASTPSLVLSAHDFSLFCRHPHLWDARGRFCDYSRDAVTCRACLRASADERHRVDQIEHRRVGAQLLRGAARVIFPSAFLRDRLFTLLDVETHERERDSSSAAAIGTVIAPGIDIQPDAAQSARHPDQIAFLGGGQDHKGGRRFPRLAAALVNRGLSVTVYGGYGHDNLLALRRIPGVHVRGYFRAGSLPALLAHQNAAVALALSVVPESFSLALSEAWAAGVPVVAPAFGAFAERLHEGGGTLLSIDPSDDEILRAIDDVRVQSQSPSQASPPLRMPGVPTAEDAAAQHLALYRDAGFITRA